MNVFILSDEIVRLLFAGALLAAGACFALVIRRQSSRIARQLSSAPRLSTTASLVYGVILLSLSGFSLATAFQTTDVGGMTIGCVLAAAALCVILSALTGMLAFLPHAVATIHGILGLLLIPLSFTHAGIGGETAFHSYLRWMPMLAGLHIVVPFSAARMMRKKKPNKSIRLLRNSVEPDA